MDELSSGLDRAASTVHLRFVGVVRSWSRKPTFTRKNKMRTPVLLSEQIIIGGSSDAVKAFRFVDEGTRAHVITARNAKSLAFNLNYSARTEPIARANVGTGIATGARVYRQSVNHPGTKARKFVASYNADARIYLQAEVKAAIGRVKRR
jgi:hypothetical protein